MKITLLTSSSMRAAHWATAVAFTLIPQFAYAQATTSAVRLSVASTAASNPYLLQRPDTAALGVNFNISPSISAENDNASVRFDASLDLEKFFEKYGLDESLSLGASGQERLSERTTLSAGVSFRSSESAARQYYTVGDIATLEPDQFPENPNIDPTLANTSGRTSRLDVNASLTRLFDPTNTLEVKTAMGLTRLQSTSGADYRDTSVSITYSHLFSETFSSLVTVDGGYADYLGQRLGDGYYLTSLVGVAKQFASWLHVSAQIGGSTSSFRLISGQERTMTAWAGNIGACVNRVRDTACFTASRSTQPTSTEGITTVSAIGVSYSGAVGALATLSFNGNYGHSKRADALTRASLGKSSEVVNLSSTYQRQVANRLSAFITPSFTLVQDRASAGRRNLQILVGVSHTFGKPE